MFDFDRFCLISILIDYDLEKKSSIVGSFSVTSKMSGKKNYTVEEVLQHVFADPDSDNNEIV